MQSNPEGVMRLQTGVITPGNDEIRNNSSEGAKEHISICSIRNR